MKSPILSCALRCLLVLLFLAPLAALLLLAGCSIPSSHHGRTAVQKVVPDAAEMAGNAACAECHRKEFELHQGSRHANTMQAAEMHSLGRLAPPIGPIPKTAYSLREQNGALHFARSDQPAMEATVRYALGTKNAMTYVGEFTPEGLTEFRMTYLPTKRLWCVTPGQDGLSNLSLGLRHEMGMARRCIGCHAMKTLPGSTEPDPGFLGVGCESCHGPGSAHIAAVRAGRFSDLKMEDMSRWGAARINAICARCHRSLDNISLEKEDSTQTGRFQAYGLALSPCFQKSGDRLSCITCHNPHKDVSTDRRAYEKICLSCHSPTSARPLYACTVNPKKGCIACHMPDRPIFADPRIPIAMADHLILIHRSKR